MKNAKSNEKLKVVVGLSGGVDSSLSAALLREQGYEVTGVFLECWKEPGCRTDEDRKDALEVALRLKIPFKVLDFRKEYKNRVVDYFYDEYMAGRTPNPDVMCNREIKFGLFYDWALNNGFDFVATGHYARIGKKRKNYQLLKGVDEKKDQSYFLYRLRQDQLPYIMFPIGEMKKEEVRKEARKRDLAVADKPDSQGICFIGPVDIQKFLREKLEEKKGEVVDTEGNVIGEHDGVWFYTIGQRHGFTLLSKSKIRRLVRTALPPLYVIKKDKDRNELVVGFGAETFRDEIRVEDVHMISEAMIGSEWKNGFKVRIRHGGELINSKIRKDKGSMGIKLDQPQRGVAPGQSAVFYRREECVGGGVVS